MMQSTAGVAPPPPTMDPQQQQQQWMMMQAQPHHQQQHQPQPQQAPVWNQQVQPQPQPQPQQQPQYPSKPQSADEVQTLWIGDLQYWMEESYISSCFAQAGEVVNVKVIRNKQTGQVEGYGFIEFVSHAAAERALQTFNGTHMPNTEQMFRLNWASFGVGEKRPDDSADYTIFVGDLAAEVTDFVLQDTFRSHYSSVKGAKIVTDRLTGRSKGYGFVRFSDESEQLRAMTEMNGMFCSSRPMRIGPAATKKNIGAQQQYPTKAPYQSSPQASQSENNDPNNTTIFVGGLDSNVTEDLLRQVFSQFGELIHVKIPVGKRCGFVQFAQRPCAEEALLMLQGHQLGSQAIRLSWGRSPSNKQDTSAGWVQPQTDPNQWNGGYYGYGQGYETYGYAPPAQDPNMYAYGGYPGYGNYQQQQ